MELVNLDAVTRRHMLEEIDRDIKNGELYMSPRLSMRGRQDYPGLLREAAQRGDVPNLAAALQAVGRLEAYETAIRKGRQYTKRVPVDAHYTLAEGEFNRFYIRAICLRTIEEKATEVVIYRAKAVAHPRPESGARTGALINASQLLADLRANVGIDTALAVPAGPNSGLSVRLANSGVPAHDEGRGSPPEA